MLDYVHRMIGRNQHNPGGRSEIALHPIGVVRNSVRDPRPDGWDTVDSRIILAKDLAEALLGLDGYSHLVVLFWMHLIPISMRGSELQVHPGGRSELSLQGILATRGQLRPSPIGITVVPIVNIIDSTVHVRGLDAVNGTPVLDIKPYIPTFDSVADARVPGWAQGE